MKKSPFSILAQLSTVALLTGVCAATAFGQGRGGGGGGGFNTGSGGFNTGTGGFTGGGNSGMSGTGGNTGNTGGNSSSLFNSGSSSSSSLFNSSSSSSNGNSSNGGNAGGNGAGGAGTGNAQTSIETGQIGAATPITRGAAIERNTQGAYLINSNAELIGGQPGGNSNQFANLFSQIGRQINQGGNFNQQGGRNRASASAIRIPLRVGFAPRPVSAPQFTARFGSRLANLNGLSAIGPIQVTMEGSTAVLTGVVASEQDREVAAGVAMLEPEVGSVRNELTVQRTATGEEVDSPSNVP